MPSSVAEIFESMAWGPAPEAAEPAQDWLERHGRRFGHFVGERWRRAEEPPSPWQCAATSPPLRVGAARRKLTTTGDLADQCKPFGPECGESAGG